MLFFTSDLHFGHVNAIKFRKRPFSDIEEMNEGLISNINETVMKEDELWILGDFAYQVNREEVRSLREKIVCRCVHLISGNHDLDYTQDHIFQSVSNYKELMSDYGRLILFHYPIYEWNAANYGSIHLHGHIHSTGRYNSENLSKRYMDRLPIAHFPKSEELGLRIYDVGVDANNFRPISIEQIADLMGVSKVMESEGET